MTFKQPHVDYLHKGKHCTALYHIGFHVIIVVVSMSLLTITLFSWGFNGYHAKLVFMFLLMGLKPRV